MPPGDKDVVINPDRYGTVLEIFGGTDRLCRYSEQSYRHHSPAPGSK